MTRQDNLRDLITALEYGTKVHICVVFLRDYGNEKTRLGIGQWTHKTPVCDCAKDSAAGYAACFRCRNLALKLAIRRKRSFGGCCVNGVYEYCRPILYGDAVAGVIFVGNILPSEPYRQAQLQSRFGSLTETMEPDFSGDQCRKTADIVESYIVYLLKTYENTGRATFDPLLENMKNYIAENLNCGFSMGELSAVFNYNEKYLGRYFKLKTGLTVREYCNRIRINRAKELLQSSCRSVTDIAGQVGYNNVTYFNRIFRQTTGVTPTQFQRDPASRERIRTP